jgi:hypothetical protein
MQPDERQEPGSEEQKPEKEKHPPEFQRLLNLKRAQAEILKMVGDAKEASRAKEE